MEIKRVLWPTDFSENAASALPYVQSLSEMDLPPREESQGSHVSRQGAQLLGLQKLKGLVVPHGFADPGRLCDGFAGGSDGSRRQIFLSRRLFLSRGRPGGGGYLARGLLLLGCSPLVLIGGHPGSTRCLAGLIAAAWEEAEKKSQ